MQDIHALALHSRMRTAKSPAGKGEGLDSVTLPCPGLYSEAHVRLTPAGVSLRSAPASQRGPRKRDCVCSPRRASSEDFF